MAGISDTVLIEIKSLFNSSGVKEAKAGIQDLNVAWLASTAVLGAAIGLAEKSIDKYVSLGDSVRQYSQITGESAEMSTRQVVAFGELGVSAETAEAAMFKLGKAIELTPKKLEAVGIEIGHNVDGSVDLNKTLLNVINAYQTAGDAAQRDAIVFTAFGRAGATMIPILETNAAQLKQLEGQVQVVYSQADLDRIRQYEIGQKQLKQSTDDLWRSIGEALLPVQKALVDSVNENIYVDQKLTDGNDAAARAMTGRGNASGVATQALRKDYETAQTARQRLDELTLAEQNAAAEALNEAKANDALYSAITSTTNADFALQQAHIDLGKAVQAAVDDKGKDVEVTLREKEAYVRVADATVAYAEDQAKASGETLSAKDKSDIWISTMENLISHLKGPLHDQLQAYINQLHSIPSDVHTNISNSVGRLGANAPGFRAAGGFEGTVTGPTLFLAGEGGSAEDVSIRPSGSSGSGNPTINIHIDHPTLMDGPSIDALTNRIAQRLRFVTGT